MPELVDVLAKSVSDVGPRHVALDSPRLQGVVQLRQVPVPAPPTSTRVGQEFALNVIRSNCEALWCLPEPLDEGQDGVTADLAALSHPSESRRAYPVDVAVELRPGQAPRRTLLVQRRPEGAHVEVTGDTGHNGQPMNTHRWPSCSMPTPERRSRAGPPAPPAPLGSVRQHDERRAGRAGSPRRQRDRHNLAALGVPVMASCRPCVRRGSRVGRRCACSASHRARPWSPWASPFSGVAPSWRGSKGSSRVVDRTCRSSPTVPWPTSEAAERRRSSAASRGPNQRPEDASRSAQPPYDHGRTVISDRGQTTAARACRSLDWCR